MTGIEHAKQQLARKVLTAVKESESISGQTVLNIDVLLLKQEQSDIDKTILTASSQALGAANVGVIQ